MFTSFVEKLIFHHKALTHLFLLISILSHPTQSWYYNSFVWKDFFSFSSVIIHVELKNGKENIKKNQKMHQGYTIATKTHAEIKKWKATSSFICWYVYFCRSKKLVHIKQNVWFVWSNRDNHDPLRRMYLPRSSRMNQH